MGLLSPVSGDSNYPASITSSLQSIDEHDHSSGKGVQIPSGGLADNSISTAKIQNAAVSGVKILDAAVVTAKIADANVTTAKIADAAVTQAKRAALGHQISSDINFSTSSTTFVDVTNATISITTTGRPVYLGLIPGSNAATGSPSILQLTKPSPTVGSFVQSQIKALRGTTSVYVEEFTLVPGLDVTNTFEITARLPASAVWFIDMPSAGAYTYKLQALCNSITDFQINNCKLIAYEL